MKLTVNRYFFGKNYVIGSLLVNGKYFCDTLEDTNRDLNKDGKFNTGTEKKIKNETCIPFGAYDIILSYSNRFKRVLPEILNVPEFSGIRIHSGNSEVDTSGCILVGKNMKIGKLLFSRLYFKKLFKLMKIAISNGEKITISIN